MRNIYKILALTTVVVGAMSTVYARPPWEGAETTREEWIAEKKESRGQSRQKAVSRAYLYVDTEATEVDYETEPWGMVLVHHRREWAMANAHNLTPDVEYTLYAGETRFGSAYADEYGDIHIKADFPDGFELAEGTVWTLVGDMTLTSTDSRIMPLKEEEMEEEEMDDEYNEGEETEY